MSARDDARLRQRRGADPGNSAFVMANAGSGKTRVLIERVTRMLLQRVNPQQILCITFTKAAAAEMSERLFETLGGWALLDDHSLQLRIAEIEGVEFPRDVETLAEIRRLFAQALETPGGLRIQTIHSFCEGLLRRFPLEAGITPGFSVIEDAESQNIITATIDKIARAAVDNDEIESSLSHLSAKFTEDNLRTLLSRGVAAGLEFSAMADRYGGIDGAIAELAAVLDVRPDEDEGVGREAFLHSLDVKKMTSAHEALLAGGKNAQKLNAIPIGRFLSAENDEDRWDALEQLFLKSTGDPRQKYGDKKTNEAHPWLSPFLLELEEKFAGLRARMRAEQIFYDSAAYHRLVSLLRDSYAAVKTKRAALDFDDLIISAMRLLQNEDAAWVRYKLDYGIDHILVDESQDTSPEQWNVIRALLGDYLSGDGARDIHRTFFSVGDVKQSIYSFQGADAEVFEEQEADLGKALAAYHERAGGAYKNIDMQMSFRTTAPVLAFVDAVFGSREASAGLGKSGVPTHFVNRVGEAGLVEIWPLAPALDTEKGNAWDAPVDAPKPDHPVERLGRRVADTIAGWLNTGETLASLGRPIQPDDVLILVQRRGREFDAVLRALAIAGVPVAGADRLKLLSDPAVQDLLSFMKFCVQTRDDLSLAETLKSPLFGFVDDDDLFPLAYERDEKESLWSSLRHRASAHDKWDNAFTCINAAKKIALREGAYAFLTHILEADSGKVSATGRRLFNVRLSKASRDGIDEMLRQALAYEHDHPRSTRGFIDWFQENASEIKREMERGSGAVRVMTVHGAKGLEANIVFLIDASRRPNFKDLGAPMELIGDGKAGSRTGRLMAIVGAKTGEPEVTAASRAHAKAKTLDEYRRLFYVAATRARDRLYIAGAAVGNEKDPRS